MEIHDRSHGSLNLNNLHKVAMYEKFQYHNCLLKSTVRTSSKSPCAAHTVVKASGPKFEENIFISQGKTRKHENYVLVSYYIITLYYFFILSCYII